MKQDRIDQLRLQASVMRCDPPADEPDLIGKELRNFWASLFEEAHAHIASLQAELADARENTAEACAKLCERNADAWAEEVKAAKERDYDPALYEAQRHEAAALAYVIRDEFGLSREDGERKDE